MNAIEVKMKTPITYYGGKQKMLKIILPMIPEHDIYVEPFFGGGAVFWAKEPVNVEFVNDKNGEVANFYRVLKNDFDALKKQIDSTLHSEFMHKEARSIYFAPEGHDKIMRAWAVWVLSHQSFYSILGSTWKCAKTRNIAKQLQRRKEAFSDDYSCRLERTSIFCRDALDIIKKADHEDAFHYVDPPYFNADMGHYGGYTRDDFVALLDTLSNVRGKFMLSSYPSDVLLEYASRLGWHTYEFELSRSAGGGRKVEVLTLNYTPPTEVGQLDVAA
ncbi:DNA adenine methylase [Tannerella forsythia]|uniref:DNA adenine methylase n=1 Tax=Tannerella forsythia TaxID=28112 RepID=UPI0024304147|nr:DNA adenine methylase [Tannerella forsythia]